MRWSKTWFVILAVAVGACGSGEDGYQSYSGDAASVTPEPADPFSMQVGDCFDDTDMGVNEVSEVPGLPCSAPHDNEVYALFDLPPGDFPGDEQVDASAALGCYERFEDAIGRSYEESEIDYIAMYPTEDSWNRIGDREVVCIAFHMEYEKLTASVLGSGR